MPLESLERSDWEGAKFGFRMLAEDRGETYEQTC